MRLVRQALLAGTLTGACLPVASPAQKVEREYRLDRAEVPAPTLAYLDSAFAERGRTHFFYDVGEDAATLEAKFRLAGARYSVEFAPTGDWLDTEVGVDVEDVPPEVWSEACAAWDERFERYRVARVQHHRGRDGSEFYEVELSVREAREWSRYELAIDTAGEVLRERLVELAPGHLDRW